MSTLGSLARALGDDPSADATRTGLKASPIVGRDGIPGELSDRLSPLR
jgi:hypothetical protein